MQVPYGKPSLTVSQQIDLLQSRGITMENRVIAEKFLTYHNYYYLSGYVYYFEKKGPARTHELARPVSFNDIIRLVRFDQDLRELFFSAVQIIEMAVRSSVARNLSLAHGPFCLEKRDLFKNSAEYEIMLGKIRQAVADHKKEAFITHFSAKYAEAIPPVWVLIEILTFGNISRLYSNLKNYLQKRIASDFKTDHYILASWLKAVTELRNACAHHARLWNKVFVNYPMIRNTDKSFPLLEKRVSRLGSFIPLIIHLINVTGEKQDWVKKCIELLKGNVLIKPTDLGLAGWWA